MKPFGIRHPWRWIALAFGVMVLTGLAARHGLLPHPLQGKPLPEFIAEPVNGDAYIFRPAMGRVIILEFWASWCMPCMVALPRLEAVHAWTKAEGVNAEIYCVNVGEPPERAASVWAAKQLTMPLLLDPHHRVADRFRVSTFPTMLIAANGRVEEIKIGTRRTHPETLKERIRYLLATTGAPKTPTHTAHRRH